MIKIIVSRFGLELSPQNFVNVNANRGEASYFGHLTTSMTMVVVNLAVRMENVRSTPGEINFHYTDARARCL